MKPPVRLRPSRAKGFNLQRLSWETNRREAVVVTRPGRWGNPFRVTADRPFTFAIAYFRQALDAGELRYSKADIEAKLRGKNLACWCEPGAPCHADILLAIANRRERP
ncbi:MAG: DUF4326 domain-containing protein [Rhizomicrobium sp.]